MGHPVPFKVMAEDPDQFYASIVLQRMEEDAHRIFLQTRPPQIPVDTEVTVVDGNSKQRYRVTAVCPEGEVYAKTLHLKYIGEV